MSRNRRQSPRKPATKMPNLHKKMQKQRPVAKKVVKGNQ